MFIIASARIFVKCTTPGCAILFLCSHFKRVDEKSPTLSMLQPGSKELNQKPRISISAKSVSYAERDNGNAPRVKPEQ